MQKRTIGLNNYLQKTEKLSDIIRKRETAFYGLFVQRNPEGSTRKIFDNFYKYPRINIPWLIEVKQNLASTNVPKEKNLDGSTFRKRIKEYQGSSINKHRLARIKEDSER